jgi:hypothetical protein
MREQAEQANQANQLKKSLLWWISICTADGGESERPDGRMRPEAGEAAGSRRASCASKGGSRPRQLKKRKKLRAPALRAGQRRASGACTCHSRHSALKRKGLAA